MKGGEMKGGVLVASKKSVFTILGEITNLNDISIVQFGGSSVGGYIYKVTINNNSYVNDNLYSIYPGKTSPIEQCTTFIIKLLQIGDTGVNNYNDKEITTHLVFTDEIYTQTTVFNESMSMWCEPICPNIVETKLIFKGVTDNNYQSLYKFPIFEQLMNLIFASPDISIIGVIVMEMLENCNEVANLFPNYYTSPHVVKYNQLTDAQKLVSINYLYQLGRLKKLGYIHKDPHLCNALYVSNYNYAYGYRVYLIDFGRTVYTGVTNVTDMNEWVHVDDDTWWSYHQMIEFTKTQINKYNSGEMFISKVKEEISEARANFISKLYSSDRLTQFATLSEKNFPQGITNPIENFKKDYVDTLVFNAYEVTKRHANGLIGNKINVNNTSICCKLCDNNNNCKYITTSSDSAYDQDIALRAQEWYKKHINTQCFYVNTLPNVDGIFLWIIGEAPDGKVNVYFSHVVSCFEIGTKHAHIIRHYALTNIYVAGEMKKIGDDLKYNLASGTYMIVPFMTGVINSTHISRTNITTKLFMQLKMPNQFTITPEYADDVKVIDHKSYLFETDKQCCSPLISTSHISASFINSVNTYLTSNNEPLMFNLLDNAPDGCQPTAGGKRSGSKLSVVIKSKKYNSGMRQDIELGKYELNQINKDDDNKLFIEEIANNKNETFLKNSLILSEYVKQKCKYAMDVAMLDLNVKNTPVDVKDQPVDVKDQPVDIKDKPVDIKKSKPYKTVKFYKPITNDMSIRRSTIKIGGKRCRRSNTRRYRRSRRK